MFVNIEVGDLVRLMSKVLKFGECHMWYFNFPSIVFGEFYFREYKEAHETAMIKLS